MNIQKYSIVLSIQLLIAAHALDAAPFVYATTAQGYDGTVVVIDAATNKIVTSIPLPAGVNPDQNADSLFIAIMPNNKYAYVMDKDTQAIYVIDIASNAVLTGAGYPITTGVGIKPKNGVFTPDSKYLYVASDGDEFTVIDTATNTAIPGSPFTFMPPNPSMQAGFLAMSPDGSTVYFANSNGNVIIPVSTATNMSGTPIAVGDPLTTQLNGIAITADGNTMYAVDGVNGVVYPITNLKTAPTAGAGISAGASPVGIVLTPRDTAAYITNISVNTVSVVNTLTNTPVLPPIPVGNTPFALAITSNGNFIYVINFVGESLSVINTNTNSTNVPGSPIDVSVYGVPFSLAITSTAAPTGVVGVRKNNVFLLQIARMLTITWNASITPGVTSYNIYNGSALVGSVPATCPLTFNAFVPAGDNGNNFSVTAVSTLGGESARTPVVIS
jgi:DNA-binding beta-propeller fold protein YncE